MAKKKVVEKPAAGETDAQQNPSAGAPETQPLAPPAKKEKKAEVRTEVTAAKELCEQIMSLAEEKGWHFVNEVQAVVDRHQ